MWCITCSRLHLCFLFTGISASPAAHSVRALYPLSLPILRQCLLHDGWTLCLQHSLPAHEREGEVRLMQRNKGKRKWQNGIELVKSWNWNVLMTWVFMQRLGLFLFSYWGTQLSRGAKRGADCNGMLWWGFVLFLYLKITQRPVYVVKSVSICKLFCIWENYLPIREFVEQGRNPYQHTVS